MKEFESQIMELIEKLSKVELIELRDKINDKLRHMGGGYMPGDSVRIAEYAKRFNYSEERKEEVLKN